MTIRPSGSNCYIARYKNPENPFVRQGIVVDRDGRLRARPSADFSRLNFLRVMRSHPGTFLSDPGGLIGPPWPLEQDAEPAAETDAETGTGDEAADG